MKTLIMIFLICCANNIFAQRSAKLPGTWEGKISVGVELRVVFHFAIDSSGQLTGTTDSPDQGVKDVPCSNILMNGDSLSLDVKNFGASFRGIFKSDSAISGELIQGKSIDLVLKKVLKVSTLNRPQTPVPPFPYVSEDVEYDNTSHNLHYGATITIPKGKGPFPAVLLITGSGPQNRDEEILEHKPFLIIADELSRNGIMVMRVDDRGMGKSSGTFSNSTTADFADDVNTSIEYLKKRKEVDTRHLGMLGHSEGGMIAPMVASKRNDIDFIVLLAAPGQKVTKLMQEQNVAILLSSGFDKKTADAYGQLYYNMEVAVLSSNNPEDSKVKLKAAIKEWKKNTPLNTVIATTGIRDDSTQEKFIQSISAGFNSSWFKYFLQFDPYPYLSKLHCRVLALNGDKDLQVLSQPNLAGIKSALQKSKSPGFEVKEMPGLNHLFQHCKKCTVAEYGQLEESFSPEVLQMISNWIRK